MRIVYTFQGTEYFSEVDSAGSRQAAVALTEMHVPETGAAILDRLDERGLFDIHVDRIDHGMKSARPDGADQITDLSHAVIEPHLQVVYRLDHNVYTFRFRFPSNKLQAGDDPFVGDNRIRFIGPQSLKQSDHEYGLEPFRGLQVLHQTSDGHFADRFIRGAETEPVLVCHTREQGNNSQHICAGSAFDLIQPAHQFRCEVKFHAGISSGSYETESIVDTPAPSSRGIDQHVAEVFHVSGALRGCSRRSKRGRWQKSKLSVPDSHCLRQYRLLPEEPDRCFLVEILSST